MMHYGVQGAVLYRIVIHTPRDDYRQTIETIATLVDMEQATKATEGILINGTSIR